MRVLIVDTYYPDFLREHYEQRPGLESAPYEDQLQSLYERCFGTSDYYSRHLRERGYEAVDVIVNCEPLQRRWAAERGPRFSRLLRSVPIPGALGSRARRTLLHGVVQRQIESLRPDLVYVQDLWFFDRRELAWLRERGIRVVGQIASPPPATALLRGYDLILTSFPHFVDRFKEMGIRSEYLPIAFDEVVISRLRATGTDPDPMAPRPHDVSFVGGIHPASHPQRVELLERVAARTEIEIWGYGAEGLPRQSPILRRYRGHAWGLDMYRVLAESKIVVNSHSDAAEGHANNMRLYEATGVGSLLITEAAPNLPAIFAPGSEVATYDGAEDLVTLLDRYMRDEPLRRRVAAAGQARTLGDHTYANRVGELAAILEDL